RRVAGRGAGGVRKPAAGEGVYPAGRTAGRVGRGEDAADAEVVLVPSPRWGEGLGVRGQPSGFAEFSPHPRPLSRKGRGEKDITNVPRLDPVHDRRRRDVRVRAGGGAV